ncbi:MAG TPA: D-Ala-D-Ala carboxypeptidase family metallohydrolase [Candidatus Krumholzibacteria bacterium]
MNASQEAIYLSQNFTGQEMVRSRSYPHLITPWEKLPTIAGVMLMRLVHEALQPIRDAVGPLEPTSGYRGRALNEAVGGAASSRHQCILQDGNFAAVDAAPKEITAQELFDLLPEIPARFDRCCLYVKQNRIHVDVRDWALGPPRGLLYVDRGAGWEPA